MKILSLIILQIVKKIPRGYWRIMRFVAQRDPELWDYPIKLKIDEKLVLRADLRESVYMGIFRNGYIPHQYGLDILFSKLIKCGETVYDVGANIGYTAMVLSRCVGTSGKVIAVEPSPRTFALLSRSLCSRQNVTLLNCAASKNNEKVTLYVPEELDLSSQAEIPNSTRIEIDGRTLDSISKEYGQPDFVKVDVEGFEADVFVGMKTILSHKRPPIIIFEALNRTAFNKCKSILTDCVGEEYIFFSVGNNGEVVEEILNNNTNDFIALPKWAKYRINDKMK